MVLEKRKHHYVPQFWIRRFTDATGKLYQWDGANCTPVSAKNVMQVDWLNTVYDEKWQASDWLENQLSKLDSIAAALFFQIEDPAVCLVEQHRTMLCQVLALQACRHPDVFLSGHRKAPRLAELIADAPLYDSETAFVSAATKFGVPGAEAAGVYHIFRVTNPEELEAQVKEVMSLSPQDARLPMTDALRAIDPIAAALCRLSYELIKAPAGSYFVLGDTPMPQSDLGLGFIVPLSKDLAIRAYPSLRPAIVRRQATQSEVDECNQRQWEMAASIIVGPDKSQLMALGPR